MEPKSPETQSRNSHSSLENRAQDPREGLARLLEELRDAVSCDSAWVSLSDGDPAGRPAQIMVAAGEAPADNRPGAAPHGVFASHAAYPLVEQGKTIAHLHLACHRPDAFNPASDDRARASLSTLAIFVQHALLLGWHQRQSRYLGIARELIEDLGGCGHLRECAEHLTHRMADFLDLDRAILYLANDEGTWFTCEAVREREGSGDEDGGLLPGFRIDEVPGLQPLVSGRVVDGLDFGIGASPCTALCDKLRLREMGAGVAVPIGKGDRLIGVLFALRRNVFPVLAAEEREPMCLLGRQVAPILHSHQVVERHERGARNFAELLDMSHAVSSTSDLTKIPEVIAHRARALCEADEATIFLLEPDEQTLKPVVCLSEWAEQMLQARIRIGQGLTGTVAASRRGEVINHAELDPRSIQVPGTPLEPEALLAAPLVCANRLLGVLTLHKLEGRLFKGMDLETIEIFASQAAIALENARLIARIREERTRLVTMLRQMEEGVVLVDKDGCVILANDAAIRMLGLSERDPIGASVLELLNRPDFGVVRAALERMRHEEERNVTQEYAVRGRTYLCSITAVRADETVQGEGEVILIKDISELKEIENQLLQSSKMSAVGQLAAGVAHEFNNLMASVYGYAQFMKQHPENAAVVQKGVEVILRSSERARELTTSLLTFSRRRPGRREPVDVNQILTDTLLLLHRQMEKSGVRVERSSDRIPLTVADPGKLQEVLLNMLVNAQQAMPEGGHLRVTSRVEGASIEIRIEDEGLGIPPENLSRIFEPFFTTKGPLSGAKQPGTGLGLSTAYNHIRDHGGSIRATSTPGQGTCFVVQLPIRTIHEQREETAGPPAPRSLDITGHVLVAEDDPTLSGLISEILGGLGHEVHICAEASQVLAHIDESTPDLLILNPALASTEDADLLGTLRAAAPRLPILIVTTREAGDAVEAGGDPWLYRLNKPFRNRDLISLVSRILAQSLRRAG